MVHRDLPDHGHEDQTGPRMKYTFTVEMPCGGCRRVVSTKLDKWKEDHSRKEDICYEVEGQEVVVTVSDRVAESEVRSVIEASKKKILNVKVEQESAAGR